MHMKKKFDIQKLWLFLTFFAFFYELPLINFSFDRLNPRLIDVVTLWGLVLYANKLRSHVRNAIYQRWSTIVYWFVICAIISSLILLQGMMRLFSLLAAFRYIEGLILIKILLSIEIDKRILLKAILFGLIFDAIYCVTQYGQTTTRELAPGVFVEFDAMTGPLSTSYFQIAQLLPTAVMFSLGLINLVAEKKKIKILLSCIAVACLWPILFTGSRTGLVLMVAALLLYLLLQGTHKIILLVLLVLISVTLLNQLDLETTELYTISRTIDLEESGKDNIDERVDVGTSFVLSDYDNAIALPFIGAGFDIAPIKGFNRIDYGVHSMYLYPLEQSGILGLIFFIMFLYTCVKSLWKNKSSNKLALAALALLFSTMITGLGAHNFWRGFSSGNVNTFIILFLCLAERFSNEKNKSIIDK